jgi:hypothetical protein
MLTCGDMSSREPVLNDDWFSFGLNEHSLSSCCSFISAVVMVLVTRRALRDFDVYK